MRALLIVVALGFGVAAGWVAVAARETEAEARARNTACLRGLSHSALAPICAYDRLWSVPRLTLAAVLGLGAVVALVGVAVAGPREQAWQAPPLPQPLPPPARTSVPQWTPERLLPGEGPEFERARAILAAAGARGVYLSPEAAMASARKALAAERDGGAGHG